MLNEVRKCICSVVLRGTYTQAQKCTMDTFCNLDMNWKSQGNAIEIKIRLKSLSWARNRCTFCYLEKEILSSPLFPPQAVPCHYLKMTFPLGLSEMLSVNCWSKWLLTFLQIRGEPQGSVAALWVVPKDGLQMSAPDKSGDQGWEDIHPGLCWRVWGGGAQSSCSCWETEGCTLGLFVFWQVWGRLLLLFEDSFFTATVS